MYKKLTVERTIFTCPIYTIYDKQQKIIRATKSDLIKTPNTKEQK